MVAGVSSDVVGLVLDFDRALGSGIDPEDWETARRACRGKVLRVAPGRCDFQARPDEREQSPAVPANMEGRDDLLALVIIEGLLVREVALRDHHMVEILGPSDILQPPVTSDRPRLGSKIKLTAATDMLLVELDRPFFRAAARWPSLLATIHRRLEAQRERLAIQGLIMHLARAEHRVLLLLWHLADEWGRVTPTGTVVQLPLTHDLIGQLVGSRRSTTTLAISALESAGYIRRIAGGSLALTPAAEEKVQELATSSAASRVLGESFMSLQRSVAIQNEAIALKAEARQLREQSRAAKNAPDSD